VPTSSKGIDSGRAACIMAAMPVSTPHPSYLERESEWKSVTDALGGMSRIKKSPTSYLPKLSEQTDAEYAAYLTRGVWFAGTGRTLDAWCGMLCRKAPKIEVPKEVENLLEDIDTKRTPAITYVGEVVRQLAAQGWAGTWIDWSEVNKAPFISFYEAKDILNWRHEIVNGKSMLTMVVVREEYCDTKDDQFNNVLRTQYRVLKLDPITLRVTMSLYRSAMGDSAPVVVEEREMIRRGKPLGEIPFVIHSSSLEVCNPPIPPLLDIALTNFAHFRNSADYENGLHIAGLPTPWAVGFTDDKKTTLTLGTSYAWVTENTDAKCGFLEFTGQGLGALKTAMDDKEKQMALMGARVLEQKASTGESTETVRMRSASETNSLATIADAATRSCSLVMAWAAYWAGNYAKLSDLTAEIAYVQVSKEFVASTASPTQISAWLNAYNAGAMSFETFFWNMQRGEQYQEGWTMEEEQGKIATETPPPARQPDPANKPPAKK
jgi:hypothetical protein